MVIRKQTPRAGRRLRERVLGRLRDPRNDALRPDTKPGRALGVAPRRVCEALADAVAFLARPG